MRRFSWRNERFLYARECDLCHKNIISTYHKDSPYTIYCPTCWWADSWVAEDFAQDYDEHKNFFEQFDALLHKVPHINFMNDNKSENCEYCNEIEALKDSYLAICAFYGERLLYTYWSLNCQDSVDCSYFVESSLCYDCQDIFKCYNCRYVYNCDHLIDCFFCYNCYNCENCFMCFNLKNASYCIFNKHYSKEEYQKKIKEYKLSSWQGIQKLKVIFWQEKLKHPHRFVNIKNSENCVGDYIKNSKNVHVGFDILGQENGRYIYDGGMGKDAMDSSQAGLECELMYEVQAGGFLYNTKCSNWMLHDIDCTYCDSCHNSEDLFGCCGIRKKKYCILNKQYTKEKYEKLKQKIITKMQADGEYGVFFPMHLSPFAYNESVANQWYPKTKEEILVENLSYTDDLPGTTNKETIDWSQVSDDVNDVADKIQKEVFPCLECGCNYKIMETEWQFYKKYNIPLPRFCPNCRFQRRFQRRNPRKLWKRKCMNTGCTTEFETSYAPERPETVYCEECYRKEVY
ncbi:MAG: hypothetical protein A2458_04035 [Candidatus Kerfeldbacteria bacterium RIFOXYC2_FULL_38_9]|nr:MAG: hypothetical protein A2458_04035 [Candidatus Kerfeldbacteria bacterium RIFOXYC2_FULL_38_9]